MEWLIGTMIVVLLFLVIEFKLEINKLKKSVIAHEAANNELREGYEAEIDSLNQLLEAKNTRLVLLEQLSDAQRSAIKKLLETLDSSPNLNRQYGKFGRDESNIVGEILAGGK